MNYPQIKPTLNLDFSNTKTLDPRINFRRGTPGAYYDGKTYAKAEENLIAYSEDFSQWGYGRIVQTVGQSAPDGSTDAYKIEQESGQTSSGYLLQSYNTSANKSYTFSVYAKAGTNRNYIVLRTYLSNNRFTYFDLVNGEAVNVDDRHVASISDTGNGWYRCSITYTPISSSSVQFNIYFSDNDSSITVADDSGFIYLWGAQLEQRDSVTAYTPTNGTPVTKYQPQLMFASPDQPRFDHDLITGESKGLLIEESRTNLIEYSEDFDSNIDIDFYSSTYNGYSAISPDGTFTASEIIWDDLSVAGLAFGDRPAVSPGESYTLSMYIKAGSLSKIYLYHNIRGTNEAENSGSSGIKYDLINGVVDEAVDPDGKFNLTYNAVHIGNGWHRLSVTTIMPSDAGYLGWGMYNYESNVQAGNNTAYFWGAQLEQGSFPTSYIKTSGASATRSADNASITGENFSSWYRQDEGSFEINASLLSISQFQTGRFITISDGSTNNRIQIDNNNTTLNFYIGKNGSEQAYSQWNRESVLDYKFAFALKENDVAFCKNNESIFSDSSVNLFSANKLDIKKENGDSEQLNGHIKKLSYYPQRLTNEQLQQLTK